MEHEFRGYALVLHEGADPRTGGVAIAGFTTAGMVGVIAASHIIKSLNLFAKCQIVLKWNIWIFLFRWAHNIFKITFFEFES